MASRSRPHLFWAIVAFGGAVTPGVGHPADVWTLEHVLEEARSANARLPVARAEVESGAAAVRGSRASLGPRLSIGGDLRYAPPPASYNPAVAPINEERLQLIGAQPIYDGGALRARLRASELQLRAARARYRAAERDVELEARTRYAEVIAVESEIDARRKGLERLRSYRILVRDVMAAGRGREADLLRTETRAAGEEANVVDAERRLREAQLELNELMGRDPSAPLEIAPLPEPIAPAAASDEPWRQVPDIAQAEADWQAAIVGIGEARAGRLPHFDLVLDAGLFGPGLPFPGASPSAADRLRSDVGVSLTLNLSWDLWDLGAFQASLAQARLKSEQAQASSVVTSREARLSWQRARLDLETLYRTIEIRSRAVPKARDSYLLAESLYRGGAATALEVLDAYATFVDAEIAEADAVQQYRVAEAQARRWGEP